MTQMAQTTHLTRTSLTTSPTTSPDGRRQARPRSAPVLDPSAGRTPPEVGYRRLQAFSSDLVGVARRTFEQLHDVDDLPLTGVGAQACESGPLLGSRCNELNGGGAADPRQATAAAIGETVERYSVAWADRSDFVLARAEDIARRGVPYVAPDELRLFADEQFDDAAFPFVPFTEQTPLEWTWATPLEVRDTAEGTADRTGAAGLVSGEPMLVPAQLVHMRDQVTGPMIGYATSNGLACGCTLEEATLGGLCELLERDAFMATWYGRLSRPRIDPWSDPELADFWQRHVVPTSMQVSLVDLSILVDAPVVLAVIRNERTPVAPVALGAAASPSPVEACRKAVIEAFQTRTWAKAEQREGSVLDPADGYQQVKDFDDHVRLSVHPDSVEPTRFLDASEEVVALDSLPAVEATSPSSAVATLVRRLADQQVRTCVVDVTSPDVAAGGLRVAKVLAPALSPLDSGYRFRCLGPERIRTRAHDLGLIPRPLSTADLNPVPHPFP